MLLFTFALGTSAGDLTAETLDVGYGPSVLVFVAMIAAVAFLYYALRMNDILCFWMAYILTRPLGASIGDYLAKPRIAGGLGWGTIFTSFVFLGVILILVAYLTTRKSDRAIRAISKA